ncbi:hypothetical protein L1987_86983 [Smallanthus sonchifolius]|uniref:Uncharacterized protein n=1 Tax=Smallanthus sonchifolius TaxID=185202 RepID=A0ACB8Y083_9ASTR|nr:hypothetical protein L1987_86983 [Smallanthus sonchifolius]
MYQTGTEILYLNILQSMGQAVFIYNLNHGIVFWNRCAENIYGYTAGEVIGRSPTELLAEAKDASLSEIILERTVNGESWCGQFPIKNKSVESFVVICANTPFRDRNGTLVGAMCVSTDSRPYQLNSELQPLQTSIASKISNLALKVKLKMKRGYTYHDEDTSITPRGHIDPSPFGVFYSTGTQSRNMMGENKHNYLSSKAEEWIVKDRMVWPWKGNEVVRQQTSSSAPAELDYGKMEDSGSWLSTLHVRSMDDEILWEDLITKQQIGQGSCGTVYHGLWCGSDVAVKVFAYQEFSDDVIISFRQEVSLMKRLRHPNILLFMGAVTSSPQHLCIVTEFLPRGSLFRILQRNATRLDRKLRLQMAIDIVGDFGLSRIKHQTYLQTKSGKGTPQWMALEIFCNEQANEKSDVYSYGVVLWEIVTGKVPWDDLNPMQVIAAVGFMNQRLEIPKDADPLWASLIESCWCRVTEILCSEAIWLVDGSSVDFTRATLRKC